MARKAYKEVLEVLACEIERRPGSVPGPAQVSQFVKAAKRGQGSLVLEVAEAGRGTVEAFAAAERLCCASIGWEVEYDPTLRLVITANEHQIDALAGILSSASNIEEAR